MNIPRILIAAPSSGSGKTVISCGLMAAFCRQQKNVVSCKCGPDYIDPMFHREVLGIDSQNLDLFFCEKEQLTGIFAEHAKNADLAVVEGVMGYYDGMDWIRQKQVPMMWQLPCRYRSCWWFQREAPLCLWLLW